MVGKIKQINIINKNEKLFVDMSLPENVCTTFENYGWDSPIKGSYFKYLGFKCDRAKLYDLLSIPISHLLYPFMFLLVEQHPRITDSWLVNWQLYDERGRLHGFKEVNGQWVAVSNKARKGNAVGQQTIVLNEKSKKLIEQIIIITSKAREYLKVQDSDDYRFMLIQSKSVSVKPKRINRLYALRNREVINSVISQRILKSSPFRNAEQAGEIIKSFVLV